MRTWPGRAARSAGADDEGNIPLRPFDRVKIELSEESVHLLAAPGAGDQHHLPGELREEVAEALIRDVHEGPGVLVLGGFECLADDEEALRRAFLTGSRLFGDLMPQNASGELLREVRDRGTRIGEGRTTRYSDSRFGGSLHTDGAEAPLPVPDYFTLLCVHQAALGGALQLVHARDVVRELKDRPEVLDVLRQPFHFDRRGDEGPGEPPTTPKPVLFADGDVPGDSLGVTYLRQYIEVGHARPGVPDLTAAQVDALDALDALLADPDLISQDRQQPGELAVFNNKRLLHGRTEFTDHGDGDRSRLLFRTWIRRPA